MPRKIKLQPRYRKSANSLKIVPELKISGLWLEKIGFEAGQTVCITSRYQELIIQPCPYELPVDKTKE